MEEDAWLHLPSDLLSNIALWLAVLSESTACVLALGSTCRTWRRIVSQDRRVLRVLPCQLDLKKPFKAALAGYASMLLKVGSVQLPRLVYCAAHEGNPDAAQLVARVLDEQREPAQALTFWKLAAKGGDAHAQHVVGMAFYKGARGAVRDPEQAHMWLTRAVKQELIRLAASAAEDARSPNEHSASELLADCCLVLGYIAFDGEGCKSDTEAATRWFRMSVKHGGREAEGVLGWIFNTGQYG